MSGAAAYLEITIPGFILEDPRLSDGAQILYGKITRLACRDGYCWASNSYIDDRTSARTVRRNLKQLEEARYIVLTAKGRKIELAKAAVPAKSDRETSTFVPETPETADKNGQSADKSGHRTSKFKHPKKTEEGFSVSDFQEPDF
jgi:hypothetical protein